MNCAEGWTTAKIGTVDDVGEKREDTAIHLGSLRNADCGTECSWVTELAVDQLG